MRDAVSETLALTYRDDRKCMKQKKLFDKADKYTLNNGICEKFLNF